MVAVIAVAVSSYFLFDLQRYLGIEFFRTCIASDPAPRRGLPRRRCPGYRLFLAHEALPSLAGGAVFGLWSAVVPVSSPSTIGATCAFYSPG